MDVLNFVVALHQELGVEIPETDYAKLITLDAIVTYRAARLVARPHLITRRPPAANR